MLCSTHPTIESTGLCHDCNRAICPKCATAGESPGISYCFRCAAAREAVAEHLSKFPANGQKNDSKSFWGPKNTLIFIVMPAVVLITVLLNLSVNPIKIPTFATDGKPSSSIAVVDKALRSYAADNMGRYPEKLSDLVGTKYLPREFRAENIREFVYEADRGYGGYRLKGGGMEFRGGNYK